MSLLGFSWKYIGEGNAHIVLELLNSNKVLRLIKVNDKRRDLTSVKSSVDFVNIVMNQLLFGGNIEANEIIEIPADELERVIQDLFNLRPEHRRVKSVLSKYAIIAPNLTIVGPKFNKNYCIEIKPKEGFMSACFKEYSKCYYCLKQFLKLQQREICKLSEYCPLDLFSGNKDRMKQALICLIDNPQNNFKVFRNGILIYDQKSQRENFDNILSELVVFRESIDLFLQFFIEILLNGDKRQLVLLNSNEEFKNYKRKEVCQESDELTSYENSILYKLLKLQKLSEAVEVNLEEIKDGTDDVTSIIEEYKLFSNIRNPLHMALTSAITKDCSIMISFSPNFSNDHPYVQIKDEKLPFRVSVADLEPKFTKSLLKRKETERKLLSIYKRYLKCHHMDN